MISILTPRLPHVLRLEQFPAFSYVVEVCGAARPRHTVTNALTIVIGAYRFPCSHVILDGRHISFTRATARSRQAGDAVDDRGEQPATSRWIRARRKVISKSARRTVVQALTPTTCTTVAGVRRGDWDLADESGDRENGQRDVVAADREEGDRADGGLAIEAAVDDDAADHGRCSGRTHGHRGKRPAQKLRFEHKNPNTPDRSTVLKKNG